MLTFGTSARPESVVQSVKDSKAFSGLSPEERTQTLAALRDSLGKQAVAARAEGNAPWLKALADRGIDVANPDISHVPPAQVGDYLRDSRTAVRRAVEWQLNEDPTFKRQTPDGQAQLLREAISQAHQTVARDYGIPGDPAKQLGQPPKYLFDGMPVPPEREAVAAQALEAYQRWKLAGEFGPPPAAGSRVEINPYWSDWSKSRGEVQAQRETVIERKVREAVGTKK